MVPRRTLEHRLRARYATPRFSHNTSLSPLFERIEVDFFKKKSASGTDGSNKCRCVRVYSFNLLISCPHILAKKCNKKGERRHTFLFNIY